VIGTTLAHYRITAALGAGGMGEVWRATDTRLGREVALKVLPQEFAADPDRMARFEREAKVLASLNHPNIAHLYGLENLEIDEKAVGEGLIPSRDDERAGINPAPTTVHMLVMELVEGEDLSGRIQRGPLPVDEAIVLAAILTREPDRDSLPAATPPRIRALIGRCLQRDPKMRQRDMGDARITIGEVLAGNGGSVGAPAGRVRGDRSLWLLGACVLGIGLLLGWLAPWIRSLEGDPDPRRLGQEYATEWGGDLSPDGRWLAHNSDAARRWDVYVRALDSSTGEVRVSTEGGFSPRWGGDARELFYVDPNGRMMAVPVLSLDPPAFGSPTALFDARLEDAADRQYDVFPGGERFVLNRGNVEGLEPIVVVLDWAARLEKEAR
jgi:hypothetical protein